MELILLSYILEHLFKELAYLPTQDMRTVFVNPDQVILEFIDCMSAPPKCHDHLYSMRELARQYPLLRLRANPLSSRQSNWRVSSGAFYDKGWE